MGSSWFSKYHPLHWVMLIIALLMLGLAIAVFAISFTLRDDALANAFIHWGVTSTDGLDTLMIILRNCALAGAISTVIAMLLGIFGSIFRIKVLIILHVVADSLLIIILIVCGLIPIFISAFLGAGCNTGNLIGCYQCTSASCANDTVPFGYNCYYSQSDYDAICVSFRGRLTFVVGSFFALGAFSLALSIMGCFVVALTTKSSSPDVVTQAVYIQSTEMQPQYVQQQPQYVQQQPQYVQQQPQYDAQYGQPQQPPAYQ